MIDYEWIFNNYYLRMKDWHKLAQEYDRDDVLGSYRKSFRINNERLIYFDGNSLGMPVERSLEVLTETASVGWGERLIKGWNDSWWDMPERVAGKIARVIGAGGDEVIVCDSTSVNLYKLVNAALKARKGRKKIVSDDLNFPSDLYVVQGVAENMGEGHELVLVPGDEMITVPFSKLEKEIDQDTALVVLTHVSFRSAFMYDMARVTELAHSYGALVIWDLCHAAGAVEVRLNECNADMAVGCTYKYLNGGPGSPAFLYVRKDLQEELFSPVWGWVGEKDPFGFRPGYIRSEGIRHFMVGSPGILSMCTLEPSVDMIIEAGIGRIREKSLALSGFLLSMFRDVLEPLGFVPGSPDDPEERGSHISLRHPEGYRICKALIDEQVGECQVIPDFRPPDNIRIGLAPLYNTFGEVYRAVTEMARIVKDHVYDKYDPGREGVT